MSVWRVLFVLEKNFLELPRVVSEIANALDTVDLVVPGTESGVTGK